MPVLREEEINEIRSKADIVDVIGHFIPLSRAGREYRGRCPFHNDHSPSMNVSQEKQIYKCFACGAGGNVFTFVRNFEKISFPEAVQRVAELIGYDLSVSVDVQKNENRDPRKEALYKVMDETIRYTMYQLDTASAEAEKKYLHDRGLQEESIRKFQIGYDPGNAELYRFLKAKGYAESDMVDANVVQIGMNGARDVFSERITFPIHDEYGHPIAFSARTIVPGAEAKYINTNETYIYTKGNVVYNYHRARNTARREGKIYVTEGVTDVIAFDKAGVENCVATLGTACTMPQIYLLKKIAARIVLCYDGDSAGQAAVYRAGKMARGVGCDVSVIRNETGRDPDEIIRSDGKEALRKLISQEESWMEFVFRYLAASCNMNNYQEKKEFAQKVYAEIEALPDEVDRRYFTEKLAELSGFSFDIPSAAAPVVLLPKGPVPLKVPDGTKQAEEMILEMMSGNPQAVRHFEEKLGYLLDEKRQIAAMMMIDETHAKGKVDAVGLIDETDDPAIQSLFVECMQKDTDYDEKLMDGAIRRVLIAALEKEADAYRTQLQTELNSETRELILTRYDECLKKRRRYIDEENSN